MSGEAMDAVVFYYVSRGWPAYTERERDLLGAPWSPEMAQAQTDAIARHTARYDARARAGHAALLGMSGEAMDAAARALCAEMTGPCECASPPGEPACTGPKIMARAAIVAFLRHAQASEEAGTAFLRAADGDVEQVDSSWLEAAYRAEADALER